MSCLKQTGRHLKCGKLNRKKKKKRESQRLKSFNALKNEPAKTDELVQPTNSQTLYPCLSECYGDPDLDSAPPPPPPRSSTLRQQQPTSYTPDVTHHRAQKRFRDGKRTMSAPGTPAAVTNLPMVEVARAAGPILVFRPWSDADVAEAANYICSPKDNLSKWESDIQFVREFRPTMTEVQHLMSKTLTNDFHRIQSVFTSTRMTVRLEHTDFGHRDNADFGNAVEALVD